MSKEDKRIPLLQVADGANVSITGITLANAEIGIRGGKNSSITARDVGFVDVGQAFDFPDSGRSSVTNTRIVRSNNSKWASFIAPERGPSLPVYCPRCTSIFSSRHYKFSGNFFYCFGNKEPCQNCNFEMAEVSEGIFDLTAATVSILSAPDFTYEMLRRAHAISERSHDAGFDCEEARTALVKLHHGFDRLFSSKFRKFSYKTVMLILAVIAAYFAWKQYQVAVEANQNSHIEQGGSSVAINNATIGVLNEFSGKVIVKGSNVSEELKKIAKMKARHVRAQNDRKRRAALRGSPL